MERKGLRTKLNWRFNVDDIEVPELNFESEDPKPKEETKIKTVPKKKRRDRNQKELF